MNTNIYKEKLLEEKKLLTEELKRLGHMTDKEAGEWQAVPEEGFPEADENDLADKFEDFEERSSKLEPLEGRYKDVQDALEKIDTEKFGICETCGEKIEGDRMMANPAARTCIAHMNS